MQIPKDKVLEEKKIREEKKIAKESQKEIFEDKIGNLK